MANYAKIAQYVGSMVGKSFKSKCEFTNEMLNASTSSKTNSIGNTRNTLFYKGEKLIGEIHSDNNYRYSVFATDHRQNINYINLMKAKYASFFSHSQLIMVLIS